MTKNPQRKYPPNAVLYCQQNGKCKNKMKVGRDWFFCCRSRTHCHGTKDGQFRICRSCSVSAKAKQERIRTNHQLLVKQMKENKEERRGRRVLIADGTARYILSSTSAKSRDETIRLLRRTYIERDSPNEAGTASAGVEGTSHRVIKEGFMRKKGNFWNRAFKKRYFKLLENRQLIYYKSYADGVASEERGVADLSVVDGISKKEDGGLHILTPSREWKCQCLTATERDSWYDAIADLCGVAR